MIDSPDTIPDAYLIVEKSNQVTAGIFQIAKKYGLDPAEVAAIFVNMPVRDEGEMTFLERLDQSAEMASEAVDQKFSYLPPVKRMALKFRFMSDLLVLKADQLE